MSKLPTLNKRVLWNEWEEDILRYEVMVHRQFQFQQILEKYRSQFHSSRTAKSLEAHYYRMKRSNHLSDTTEVSVQAPMQCPVSSTTNPSREELRKFAARGIRYGQTGYSGIFSDVNTISPVEIERKGLNGEPLPPVESEYEEYKYPEEVTKAKRAYFKKLISEKRQIDMLERTLSQFSSEQMDGAYGLLRGHNLRYLIRSKKVILGRNTDRHKVDVDLSEEGICHPRVSRTQAVIVMDKPGEFYIQNLGKRVIYINSTPVLQTESTPLFHYCFIEISELQFIFEVNKQLFVKKITKESLKAENEKKNEEPISAETVDQEMEEATTTETTGEKTSEKPSDETDSIEVVDQPNDPAAPPSVVGDSVVDKPPPEKQTTQESSGNQTQTTQETTGAQSANENPPDNQSTNTNENQPVLSVETKPTAE